MATPPHTPSASSARLRARLARPFRRQADFFAGNQLQLLQGSVEYFPALIAAMQTAQQRIDFETYIFDVTGGSAAVADALLAAAQRGVQVRIIIDGFGTGKMPADWQTRLETAGAKVRVFSPLGFFGLLIPSHWRRMHRKLCAVDGRIAFCGGINLLDDFHDPNHGTLESPRLDFAVRIEGPVAHSIALACQKLWGRLHEQPSSAASPAGTASSSAAHELEGISNAAEALLGVGEAPAQAALLLRDNLRARMRIERAYLQAIARAREEIFIANAYFFPSRKLLRALTLAAKRGVRVKLLLQGRYEYFLQYHATRPIYQQFLDAGVEIYEYAESFLHAKVAVIDAHTPTPWTTVGSSNLDPLSLLLAREANVVALDSAFAKDLHARLTRAMASGQRLGLDTLSARPWGQRLRDRLAYALARSMVWLVKDRF